MLSRSLHSKCELSEIIPSVCTDHSLITVVINTNENKRGPGLWKFNNELLNDQQFQQEIGRVINECKNSFGYLRGTEFWELLKFELKQFSREWAIDRSKNEKLNKFILYEKLERMQSELILDTVRDQNLEKNIANVELELKAYETVDAQ